MKNAHNKIIKINKIDLFLYIFFIDTSFIILIQILVIFFILIIIIIIFLLFLFFIIMSKIKVDTHVSTRKL